MFSRRTLDIRGKGPIISFAFDDFPRSALYQGGAILKRYGCVGTYYASAGIMGSTEPPGEMFRREDLDILLEQGHELGCHTYDHFDSRLTKPEIFEHSILRNREAFGIMYPGVHLRTFGYPKSEPRLRVKRVVWRHFLCCKTIRQGRAAGITDLNYLPSFYLEKSRDEPAAIRSIIDANREARGWLILSTHDVAEHPSKYGVTPELFEETVKYAVNSGARILAVADAYQVLSAGLPH
jgi:peptidoglycan/xylan/chitin deacetylase (PgdA/CDA1 family)